MAVALALVAGGCGGGSSNGSLLSDVLYIAEFIDAPVQGLCYSTSPSAQSGTTDATGSYSYAPGDLVTFWIDGSGSGCKGTSATSSTSVSIGSVLPSATQSNTQTFVLALSAGQQVADTVTALNVGSGSAMNVGGLKLNGGDVANLNTFILSSGTVVPSANGSVDTLFNTVQADTVVAATNASPSFVVPVAPGTSAGTSMLQNTVAANLASTAATLTGQPTSITIPAGALRFSVSSNQYTNPLSSAPTAVHSDTSASFNYYDGSGNFTQIESPGTASITTANLNDQTLTGTYSTPVGNSFTRAVNGINALNGDAYTENIAIAVDYQDSAMLIVSGTFSKTYTSGPNSGSTFVADGIFSSTARILTPLSLSMVAGHTVTIANACGSGRTQPNVLVFSALNPAAAGLPESVNLSQSCGGGTITVVASAMPGILLGTDPTGFIAYLGLDGTSLAAGAQFAVIYEANGTLGNGSAAQWLLSQPITSVN